MIVLLIVIDFVNTNLLFLARIMVICMDRLQSTVAGVQYHNAKIFEDFIQIQNVKPFL